MVRIKLTEAQVSALECRLFDRGDVILDAMYLDRALLEYPEEHADGILNALIDSSNAESDFAEHHINKGTSCAKKARGASRALDNLATKVVKAMKKGS